MGVFLKFLILIAFLFVLVGKRVKISLAIFFSALLLGFLFLIPPGTFLKALFQGVTGLLTIKILLAIYFVLILGRALEETGFSDRLLRSMEGVIPDRRVSLVIPALVFGLFPVPAGAMLSAPMAEKIGNDMGISAEHKFFFNYWFRHVWEFSWPLYAGVILGSGILGIPIGSFSLKMMPLVGFTLLVGLVMLFLLLRGDFGGKKSGGRIFDFLWALWPVYLIVFLVLIVKLHFLLSLLVAVVAIFTAGKVRLRRILGVLREALEFRTFLLIISIMIFKRVLEISGAVEELPAAFLSYNIPPLLPVLVVPFIVGLLTGITNAGVGVTFPVFLTFLRADFGLVAVAYTAIMSGVFLSPVHLCLVVTREYFGAEPGKIYRLIIPPVILILLFSVLLNFIY